MPMTRAALNTELTTDPTALGYAALIVKGNDDGCAALLNQIRATITVFRSEVRAAEIIAATVLADHAVLTTGQQLYYNALIALGVLDVTSATLRANLAALFPIASTTRTNLVALAQRSGSRAEQLFGTGTSVSHTDVAVALRG